jgi:hypothetical protein
MIVQDINTLKVTKRKKKNAKQQDCRTALGTIAYTRIFSASVILHSQPSESTTLFSNGKKSLRQLPSQV